jgi:hypothetical protein
VEFAEDAGETNSARWRNHGRHGAVVFASD